MPKLTEYPEAQSFDENDILIKDGTNGTKKIKIEKVLEYMVDPTLTTPGKAADAKATKDGIDAVGGEVADVKNAISDVEDMLSETDTNTLSITLTDGQYVAADGTTKSNFSSSYSNFVEVHPGGRVSLQGVKLNSFRSICAYSKNVSGASTRVERLDNGETVEGEFTFTVPAWAHYFRATGASGGTMTGTEIVINYNFVSTTPQILSDDRKAQARENIGVTGDSFISIYDKIGINLYNPSMATPGFISSNAGDITDYDDYITSDYIPIEADQSVVINKMRTFLAYDSDKEPIAATYSNTGTATNNYVFTASVDGYIRASLYVSSAAKNMIAYGNTLPDYEPYSSTKTAEENVHLSGTMKNDAVNVSGNVLAGKKWVACGDSFTAGAFSNSLTDDYTFTDAPYYGKYKVYPYFIGRRNQSMTVINEAIAGSTMGGGSGGTNPFSGTRYQQIPSDADYITLEFGINDSSDQAVPLGTIDDDDNTTFYGAWNVVLGYFRENFPFAHIGIIVGPGMQTANGKTYAEAEIDIAKKWGIPYLNIQFESGGEKIPLMLRTSNPDVDSDAKAACDSAQYVNENEGTRNLHPNEKAHEFESTFIEAWLRTL